MAVVNPSLGSKAEANTQGFKKEAEEMARYNRATQVMIDIVSDDLDCHGIRYHAMSVPQYETTFYREAIEDFREEVILDCGLSGDDIKTEFANGYFSDALYTAAVQAFMAQVNWSQVMTSYAIRGSIHEYGEEATV